MSRLWHDDLLIFSKHTVTELRYQTQQNFLSSAFQSQTDLNSAGLTPESRRLALRGALIMFNSGKVLQRLVYFSQNFGRNFMFT